MWMILGSFSEVTALSLTPVQETSLLVAYWRHLETQERNGLIQDLPAGQLVHKLLSKERINEFRKSPICQCGQEILAVRTRCIDDWLLDKRQGSFHSQEEEEEEKKQRQLVNLGAGMCARYYRLGDLASYYDHMWEVDSDMELLDIKKKVLDETSTNNPLPSMPIRFIEGDLASNSFSLLEDDLTASSFEISKPTDWIVEGVLEYIDPSQHAAILDFTSSVSAPGSRMALQVLEEPLRDHFLNVLGAEALPWQELPPLATFVKCARKYGWEVERAIQPQEWKGLYKRDLSHVPGFNLVFLARKS